MGWEIGYDSDWKRDIGYGVPAVCDHPGCGKEIDRGLSYVCGGEPYGGDRGCGLYFCSDHLYHSKEHPHQQCERCCDGKEPFEPTPDVPRWVHHKETDPSWAKWREERDQLKKNEVARLTAELTEEQKQHASWKKMADLERIRAETAITELAAERAKAAQLAADALNNHIHAHGMGQEDGLRTALRILSVSTQNMEIHEMFAALEKLAQEIKHTTECTTCGGGGEVTIDLCGDDPVGRQVPCPKCNPLVENTIVSNKYDHWYIQVWFKGCQFVEWWCPNGRTAIKIAATLNSTRIKEGT